MWAGSFYVSTNGKDSWDGTKQWPLRTLQKAANRVSPGDTVYVEEGNYKPFHVTRAGNSASRIEFKAVSQSVYIDGYESFADGYAAITVLADYVTIDGFHVDVGARNDRVRSRGVRVSGEGHALRKGVVIRNNTVTNAGWVGITTSYAEGVVIEGNDVSASKGQHGIYVANSADQPVIRKNRCHDNAQAGIQINADPEVAREYGGDGIIRGAIVEGNFVYENGRAGAAAMDLASIRESLIINNLLFENHGGGIVAWDDEEGERYGSRNNKIFNNTVVQPIGSRSCLSLRHGSTANIIKNNILIHLGGNFGFSMDSSSFHGLESDFNVIGRIQAPNGESLNLRTWQTTWEKDIHSIESNVFEIFLDVAKNDYHLRPSSPAIDAGTPLTEVPEDIDGNRRPQGRAFDIGAYKWLNPKIRILSWDKEENWYKPALFDSGSRYT